MISDKTPRRFAADPIFKDFRKPTKKMIDRAKFWAEWKKRRITKPVSDTSK
jgi:hypothetical protein